MKEDRKCKFCNRKFPVGIRVNHPNTKRFCSKKCRRRFHKGCSIHRFRLINWKRRVGWAKLDALYRLERRKDVICIDCGIKFTPERLVKVGRCKPCSEIWKWQEYKRIYSPIFWQKRRRVRRWRRNPMLKRILKGLKPVSIDPDEYFYLPCNNCNVPIRCHRIPNREKAKKALCVPCWRQWKMRKRLDAKEYARVQMRLKRMESFHTWLRRIHQHPTLVIDLTKEDEVSEEEFLAA